ncbi:lipocalin family protein [Hyunsoonleella sp. 2307UL5-6]|uniref:lipocalin family protein n=1 Tax=Hyunsoonleella sp. 2307UL5-6 TaxID=3384768 RepID=UPI0039BD776E
MKKTFLFFLAIISLGCSSSDDNSNTENNSDILGKWVITQLDFEDNYSYPECAVNNNTYEFMDNGDLIYKYVTGSSCNQTGTNNYEYNVEGSVMTKIEPNGGFNPENDYIEKFNVKELTQTKLVLEAYYVDEGLDNGGGIINIPSEDRRDEIWERVN